MRRGKTDRVKDYPTNEKLIRAARKLFAEYGYQLTTTRMIAERAHVAQSAISFHYGSKENLCEAVIQYTTELIRREYGFLSEDIMDQLFNHNLSVEDAWDYIDQLISMQIAFSLDERNSTTINLMLNEASFPPALSGQLSQSIYELIEGPLSQLIQYVSDSKNLFEAAVLSRAINGAIFTFREKPILARNVLRTATYEYDLEKLQTYLHRFLLLGLKNTISNPNRVGGAQPRLL